MADDNDRVIAVTGNLIAGGFVDTSIPGAANQTRAVWGAVVPGLMIGGGGSEPTAYCTLTYTMFSGIASVTIDAGSKNVGSASIRPNGVRLVLDMPDVPKYVSAIPYGLHTNTMMMIDVAAMAVAGRESVRLDLRYLAAKITGTGSQTWAAVSAPPNTIISGTMGKVLIGVW